MKRAVTAPLLILAALAIASVAPVEAANAGGIHAFDWLVGSWTCTNHTPSSTSMMVSGKSTLTASRSDLPETIEIRLAGKNFSSLGYIQYSSKHKVYVNPSVYGDGTYGNETGTAPTGTWTGSVTDAYSGKTTSVRDTYAKFGDAKFTDVGEMLLSGKWKRATNLTCVRG